MTQGDGICLWIRGYGTKGGGAVMVNWCLGVAAFSCPLGRNVGDSPNNYYPFTPISTMLMKGVVSGPAPLANTYTTMVVVPPEDE